MKTGIIKCYFRQIHKICSTMAFCVSFAIISIWAGCLSNKMQPFACSANTKQLGDLTGPWQLFVDDYLVEEKTSVVRTYHPFKKYPGNPVLLPTNGGKGHRFMFMVQFCLLRTVVDTECGIIVGIKSI